MSKTSDHQFALVAHPDNLDVDPQVGREERGNTGRQAPRTAVADQVGGGVEAMPVGRYDGVFGAGAAAVLNGTRPAVGVQRVATDFGPVDLRYDGEGAFA